jgi:CubicO group peptidase (beta-lactamase class C family)
MVKADDELQLRLDDVIDSSLASGVVVGAVVLVSCGGVPVYRRAAGWADRESAQAMAIDGLFRLASVSKVFVSTAALVLVARGRLNLEDRLADWLPVFATLPPIMIRQLLSHSAGFGYGCTEPEGGHYARAGISDGLDRAELTLAENMRRLASAPLRFLPGTAWTYSLSIDVVGAVIEAATGMALPDAIGDLVTTPLGLAETGFRVADPGRLTTAYVAGLPEPRRMDAPDHIPVVDGLAGLVIDPSRALDCNAFPSGGAGMVGSADEVMRLLEALRTRTATLLPEALFQEMAADQICGLDMLGWPGWGHGLGFAVLRDPAASGTPEAPGTWRWGGAYGHSWFVDPRARLSAVALTNTAPSPMTEDAFAKTIRDAIYGRGV